MIYIRLLRALYRRRVYVIAGGIALLGTALFLFVPQPFGPWFVDAPIRLAAGGLLTAAVFVLIVFGLTDAADFVRRRRSIREEFQRLPIPVYEPLARTRMPGGLKEMLLATRAEDVSLVDRFIDSGERLLVIAGAPGIGKSTLAARCARRVDFWLTLAGKQIDVHYLIQQIAEWAGDEELRGRAIGLAEIGSEDFQRLAREVAKSKRRMVFTGFEQLLASPSRFHDPSVADLFQALLREPGGHTVVITSEITPEPSLLGAVTCTVITLSGLSPEDGAAIMGRTYDGDDDFLREVAESTGGNPLLLSIVPPLLVDSIEEELIREKPWNDTPHTPVSPAFLRRAAGEGLQLLQKFCFIPEPETKSFIAALADERIDGDEWVTELSRRNLLAWDAGLKKYSMHPAVAQAAFESVAGNRKLLSETRGHLLDVCFAKSEDFKPAGRWESVSDCRLFVRAVDLMMAEGQYERVADLLLRLHGYLHQWGNDRLIAGFYRRLTDHLLATATGGSEHWRTLAPVLQRYASLLLDENRIDEAGEWLAGVYFIAHREGEGLEDIRFTTSSRLAEIHARLGNADAAWRYGTEQLRLVAERDDPRLLAPAHGRMGHVCRARKDFSAAADHYSTAVELFRQMQNHRGETTALEYLAKLHEETGAWDEARVVLQRIVDIHEQFGEDSDLAAILDRQARACLAAGEPDEALVSWQRMLRRAKQTGNRYMEAEALSNLGKLAFRLERYADAVMRQQQRLQIAEELGDVSLQASAHGNMAHAYVRSKNRASAIEHYRSARSRFHKVGERYLASRCAHYLARLLAASGEWDNAVDMVLESINTGLDGGKDVSFDLRVLAMCRSRLGATATDGKCAEVLGPERWSEVRSHLV
jgi:tetratricopeptide (TPR) repeat protein